MFSLTAAALLAHSSLSLPLSLYRECKVRVDRLDRVVLVDSNTLGILEEVLGWRGLLIEASPRSFTHLAVNRPSQVCVHAAVCASEQTVHYVDTLWTSELSGIPEFFPQGSTLCILCLPGWCLFACALARAA